MLYDVDMYLVVGEQTRENTTIGETNTMINEIDMMMSERNMTINGVQVYTKYTQ